MEQEVVTRGSACAKEVTGSAARVLGSAWGWSCSPSWAWPQPSGMQAGCRMSPSSPAGCPADSRWAPVVNLPFSGEHCQASLSLSWVQRAPFPEHTVQVPGQPPCLWWLSVAGVPFPHLLKFRLERIWASIRISPGHLHPSAMTHALARVQRNRLFSLACSWQESN